MMLDYAQGKIKLNRKTFSGVKLREGMIKKIARRTLVKEEWRNVTL